MQKLARNSEENENVVASWVTWWAPAPQLFCVEEGSDWRSQICHVLGCVWGLLNSPLFFSANSYNTSNWYKPVKTWPALLQLSARTSPGGCFLFYLQQMWKLLIKTADDDQCLVVAKRQYMNLLDSRCLTLKGGVKKQGIKW